jgi:hypothetical protein
MKQLIFFTLGLAVCGCNFAVAGDNGGGGGGGGDVGGDDLSMSGGDDLGTGDDLSTGNDIAGLPIVCTAGSASCNGSTLTSCPDGTAEMMTTCALGCGTNGGAHCNQMYPRAPVTRADFDTTGLTPVTLSASSVYIGADTGLIGPSNAPIRHANTTATTYEVHDGVGFHLVAIPGTTIKLGIYTFKSLTVDANVVMNAYGTNGIALVSAGDLTMNGQFDATCAGNVNLATLFGMNRPWLQGPGGGTGGQPGVASVGFGAGGVGGVNADNAHTAGGGGGAYADVGGAGGAQGAANPGGLSGPTYGDAMLTTLVGGSGGGAGGQAASANQSFGGGGGGLAMFVAQGTLTFGIGNMSGGINAGGCGGTTQQMVGGGAGGSGGTILAQALSVHLGAMGVLAANGGGGGAGNAMPGANTNGKPGQLGSGAAGGGQTGGGADGGNGGAGATSNGTVGGTSAGAGAGGGGSVGRVRIESQSGAATVDAGGIVSPPAALGMVDIH